MTKVQRLTIHPSEAAALDRLLDAHLATHENDPDWWPLVALSNRVRGLRADTRKSLARDGER